MNLIGIQTWISVFSFQAFNHYTTLYSWMVTHLGADDVEHCLTGKNRCFNMIWPYARILEWDWNKNKCETMISNYFVFFIIVFEKGTLICPFILLQTLESVIINVYLFLISFSPWMQPFLYEIVSCAILFVSFCL